MTSPRRRPSPLARAARIAALAALLVTACARPSVSAAPVAPDAPSAGTSSARADFEALPSEQRAAFERADAVVVATVVDPKIDSILEIDPPIYVHSFALSVDRTLSGMPVPAKRISWSSRTQEKPLAAGARVIVALQRSQQTLLETRDDLTALRVDAATPALEAAIAGGLAPAADGLRIAASQVAAAKIVKWQNEYGDGVFELTITNDGAAPRAVPGLSVVHGAKGDEVLFADALEIRDEHGRVLRLPASGKTAGAPLVLSPGASVTTRVDVKPFGLANPYGGAREYYSFAIGGLRVSSFFYYSHALHGPQMGRP
jgi:hypothetical protein